MALQLPVSPNEFCKALQAVGLVPESNHIKAIYISADASKVAVEMEIVYEVDDRLFDIVPELTEESPRVA